MPERRVRHPLPEARWPTAEEAARSLLFSPLPLGRTLVAESRTWVPAMVPWRATGDGFVTPEVLDWYGRFARGRPGTIVVEATGIRDVPSGPLLRVGHDRFVPGLRSLVERVRRESGGRTRLFLQVLDFLSIRRRPKPADFFRRFLAITPELRARFAAAAGEPRWSDAPEAELREALLAATRDRIEAVLVPRELESLDFGHRERVTDLHLPHVRDLPRVLPGLFADAAARARDAGFDGVELHFAHAYTMASFLSPLNLRDDGYGGPRESRVRLPLEVIGAVRARVGAEWCVGVRFLGDEAIAGGFGPEEAAWFGARFAEAGVDYLSVSRGGKFEDARQPAIGEAAYPYTGPSGSECMPTTLSDALGPFGRNAPLAAAVRRAVRAAGSTAPVVASGGIGTFDLAEAILRRGDADAIAAARQSLADPDWWLKMRLGRGAEVRRCTYTNYCEGLDQRHRQVTCKLWDRAFRAGDASVALAADGRRRLVAPEWDARPADRDRE
ncbi:MAG TPA: NADH:flavin oxidoreductase [Planctomycetota bacterium]|nr:NADH:flavin oxidoreductase [Planctomycetota bacterium]